MTQADDERRGEARADEHVGLGRVDHDDRVGAVQALHRVAHGLDAGRALAAAVMRDEVRDDLGVGLALEHDAALDSSSRLISTWFSMMPLCTTATLPERCGCALSSVGGPWVAQRVWPMPVAPSTHSLRSFFTRLSSLPSERRRAQLATLDDRDAGRVVAAVLEAPEALDHDVHAVDRAADPILSA